MPGFRKAGKYRSKKISYAVGWKKVRGKKGVVKLNSKSGDTFWKAYFSKRDRIWTVVRFDRKPRKKKKFAYKTSAPTGLDGRPRW